MNKIDAETGKLIWQYEFDDVIKGTGTLWRMDQKWIHSYSRDADGSSLILNDTEYLGFENSYFTVFDPNYRNGKTLNGMFQPNIIQ
ncbi:MAG: hypothetical protein GQ564_05805 [Bacteroidales bacterium]|nr:hypothetical protein [Bacteroidales bacterium]